MERIVKESKKVVELQPKINAVFNEINNYASGYKALEKSNHKYKKEIENLKYNNEELKKKNTNLIRHIQAILEGIKRFFRRLLQIGNEIIKEAVSTEIKDYYDYEDFTTEDVKDIAIGTRKVSY